ncbi:MAG: sensor histidine kinase [Actinomycetota bacterium]
MIAFVSLAVGFALTFDPSFADARSTTVTLLPFVLLPTIAVAFTRMPINGPASPLLVATLASVAGWTVLMLDDERWVALTFALYGLTFALRTAVGIPIAVALTGIWMLAWWIHDTQGWLLIVPPCALAFGLFGQWTFIRAQNENNELADVIAELRATQADLAASERENGVLEERARVAGEIHDTLAQGFTSIVMLARSAIRTGDEVATLPTIETVAADNLQAARRLVAAMGPAELDAVSLPHAMARHVDAADGADVEAHFEVFGTPRSLGGAAEEALLRALQETMRNVTAHAGASQVHVTLGYLDDRAVLDVVDDGTGFEPGCVADRGDLTGGQGLAGLGRRVRSLGGTIDVESTRGSGTAVSVQIPIGVT